MAKVINLIKRYPYELAFFISAAATVGSLILSNILNYLPCELCWYQRIFMFPLPFILGAAMLRRDKQAHLYVWPLALVGGLIAFYQSLLQWGVIKEDLLSCSLTSQSCAVPQINWFGFLTIPFGSFIIFLTIGGLMWLAANSAPAIKFGRLEQDRLVKLIIIVAISAIAAVLIINRATV
ncbi:MAG TPA: disulfide bond formation protein B [Candidatus Saccharimonadales bacterium]